MAAAPLLDATRLCLPPEAPSSLLAALARARRGELAAARAALESVGAGEVGSADRALALAMLDARRAEDAAARRQARMELREPGASPGVAACAFLELARLELLARRFPEARAAAARARRSLAPAPLPASLHEAALFIHAEALHGSARAGPDPHDA